MSILKVLLLLILEEAKKEDKEERKRRKTMIFLWLQCTGNHFFQARLGHYAEGDYKTAAL
jgi:hypothetical protein